MHAALHPAQVDWDYHMRLSPLGTPGTDAKGSIVHFYHFRHWRLTGVAYEVRHCSYTAPNWTLLSTATGRTREFKDRCVLARSITPRIAHGDPIHVHASPLNLATPTYGRPQ